jgi:hypothetical protein
MGASLLESGLLQNAVERAGCQIVTGLSCDRHSAGFAWMLELAVTASCGNLIPAVSIQSMEDVLDLHAHQNTKPVVERPTELRVIGLF